MDAFSHMESQIATCGGHGSIIKILEAEQRLRRRTRITRKFGTAAVLSTSALLGAIAPLTGSPWSAFLVALPVGSLGLLYWLARPSDMESRAIQSLGSSRSKDSVGVLAEALNLTNVELREIAAEALIRLLPTMEPHELEGISCHQRNALYAALNPHNPRLSMVIVGMIRSLRDITALSDVQRIARFRTKVGLHRALRDAAAECALLLQDVGKYHGAGTLLRSASRDSQMSLLKPATSDETDDSTLLRSPVNVEHVSGLVVTSRPSGDTNDGNHS